MSFKGPGPSRGGNLAGGSLGGSAPQNAGGLRAKSSGRAPLPANLPIAWMDPMSWRLPSGQALAEFALQSGFLAPLMLGGAMGGIGALQPKRKPPTGAAPVDSPAAAASGKPLEAGQSVTFRRGF